MELLVVIGVLGILAAGLLATIDPLEQLRKGADSNRKTTALELVNALTRYYATKGVMPWVATASGGDGCLTGAPTTVNVSTGFAACLTALENMGELKSTFKNQTAILQKLFVSQTGSGESLGAAVCYDPESKTESLRAETIYENTGAVKAGCPTTGTCFWCAQ